MRAIEGLHYLQHMATQPTTKILKANQYLQSFYRIKQMNMLKLPKSQRWNPEDRLKTKIKYGFLSTANANHLHEVIIIPEILLVIAPSSSIWWRNVRCSMQKRVGIPMFSQPEKHLPAVEEEATDWRTRARA